MKDTMDLAHARMLVVEDSLADIALMKAFFTREKISNHITYVRSLAQARTELSEHVFDICFIDVHLPDGEGFDLVGDINTQDISVIMLSGSEDMEHVMHAKGLGVMAYISKPLNKAKLDRLVAELRHFHWSLVVSSA